MTDSLPYPTFCFVFQAATFNAVESTGGSEGKSFEWTVVRPLDGQSEREVDLKAKRRLVLEINRV